VEVGPGPGLLTRELLARAGRVVAVEKDEAMAALLRDLVPERLTVVEGDMLAVEPASLVPQGTAYKVVANLPYYVAVPILRRFLEATTPPAVLVVLLQREVAESIAAEPGTLSVLGLSVQYYAVPRLIGIIKPGSFYPPPQVDSGILRLDVRERPAVDVASERFFRVVRAAFSAKRKQIVNPLARELGLEKERATEALGRAGIDPQRRAETLSMLEWEALCHALPANLGQPHSHERE
jgi:16S rRNA (adenine1518-N6/adenine1519-N6)-dimethyltransferase